MTSVMTGCSITKFIPENEFLINKVMIESTDKSINASEYEPYIKQKGNTKWFSALRIPLATYSLAGKDSTKWINKNRLATIFEAQCRTTGFSMPMWRPVRRFIRKTRLI